MGKPDNHIVLYRKYRSRSFSEVVGQDHIISPLKKEIETGRIAHAYLFTGPKGVGKTSVARIFAFSINDLPYENQLPIDIIEIDGASNRRIDEVRELKERIHIAPVQAKYKVYIIDEVHMLTKEAFNALLKTLEEPPSHAVFILATTEAHKLPPTIISRTQRHTFRPISEKLISQHLAKIASKEGIETEDDATRLIAKMGQGSLRDAISLFDQVSSLGDITLKNVEDSLGLVDVEEIASLAGCIENETPKEVVALLQELLVKGSSPTQLSKQLINYVRAQKAGDKIWLDLIDSLILVGSSLQPEVSLEVAVLRANLLLNPSAKLRSTAKINESPESENKNPQDSTPEPKAVENEPATSSSESNSDVDIEDSSNKIWEQVLGTVKAQNNTLYTVLRMSDATIDGNEIKLGFQFDFHKKQIDSPKNKQIIADTVSSVTGHDTKVTTHINESSNSDTEASPTTTKKQPENPQTDSVLKAFGGGEVVKL